MHKRPPARRRAVGERAEGQLERRVRLAEAIVGVSQQADRIADSGRQCLIRGHAVHGRERGGDAVDEPTGRWDAFPGEDPPRIGRAGERLHHDPAVTQHGVLGAVGDHFCDGNSSPRRGLQQSGLRGRAAAEFLAAAVQLCDQLAVCGRREAIGVARSAAAQLAQLAGEGRADHLAQPLGDRRQVRVAAALLFDRMPAHRANSASRLSSSFSSSSRTRSSTYLR